MGRPLPFLIYCASDPRLVVDRETSRPCPWNPSKKTPLCLAVWDERRICFQLWHYDLPTGEFISVFDSTVFDVGAAPRTGRGSDVIAWPSRHGKNQQWAYDRDTEHILSAIQGLALDVKNGVIEPGGQLCVSDAGERASQRWGLRTVEKWPAQEERVPEQYFPQFHDPARQWDVEEFRQRYPPRPAEPPVPPVVQPRDVRVERRVPVVDFQDVGVEVDIPDGFGLRPDPISESIFGP
jgi:hypothetical protein